MKLTRSERKMVIEHAAQECANELPANDAPDFWMAYDKVMEKYWLDLLHKLDLSYRDSLASGWRELVEFTRSADELDRDPGGHLYEMGIEDTEQQREFWKDHYNMTIGASIDSLSYRAS